MVQLRSRKIAGVWESEKGRGNAGGRETINRGGGRPWCCLEIKLLPLNCVGRGRQARRRLRQEHWKMPTLLTEKCQKASAAFQHLVKKPTRARWLTLRARCNVRRRILALARVDQPITASAEAR